MQTVSILQLIGKICKKCYAYKSLDSFTKRTQAPDGKASECRDCAEKIRIIRKTAKGWIRKVDRYIPHDGIRHCNQCKQWKSELEFDKRGTAQKSACKECRRKEQQQKPAVHRWTKVKDNTKECSKCHEYFSFERFYPSLSGNIGLSSKCISCQLHNKHDYLFTHRGIIYKRLAQRNLALVKACPSWLSEEQKRQIENIYRNRPDGYHVDHIIPLQNKNVCGLHVPWNMQCLKSKENMSKSNRFDFTYENRGWQCRIR